MIPRSLQRGTLFDVFVLEFQIQMSLALSFFVRTPFETYLLE
jgi:hypothetical protein